jgi:hypothetical protein
MANHEPKEQANSVDLLLAFQRKKDGNKKSKCLRVVIKDFKKDLFLLEMKCQLLGGQWRIHKTVNSRDTEKARIWLIHKLIDFPEGRGYIDSLWRTALLQPECIYGEKKFLLDLDTKSKIKLEWVNSVIPLDKMILTTETINGWHYITKPFDTRELLKLPYVSLSRDGYVFIKKVGEDANILSQP